MIDRIYDEHAVFTDPVVRGIDILTIRDGRIRAIRTIVVEGSSDAGS